jgi:uncharacterized membrane protein
MTAETQIESYMNAVKSRLGSLTGGEREEIAGEIAARIRAAADEPGSDVESVLARLGPPERLAVQYRDARLIAKASESYLPPVLMHALARSGILGVLVFIIGIIGYWVGGGLLVFGLLAFLWSLIQPNALSSGPTGSATMEILRLAGGGCLILLFTTFVLRAALRFLRRPQSPL